MSKREWVGRREVEWVTKPLPAYEHSIPRAQRTLMSELLPSPADFDVRERCLHRPVQVVGGRLGHLLVYLPEPGCLCLKVFMYRVELDEFMLGQAISTAEAQQAGQPLPVRR